MDSLLFIISGFTCYLDDIIVVESRTTSFATVQALSKIFARYDLHEILVSDNGSQFKSIEFE